jgi:hypothetical protein
LGAGLGGAGSDVLLVTVGGVIVAVGGVDGAGGGLATSLAIPLGLGGKFGITPGVVVVLGVGLGGVGAERRSGVYYSINK